MSATEQVKKTKTRSRRDYKREIDRVTLYLQTVIFIKSADDVDDTATGDGLKGELKAYRNTLAYLEGKGK